MMDFNDDNVPVNDDINEAIKQELESWDLFGDVLKNDDKTLFHNMMSELKDYYKSMGTKGELMITESMLMALIHVQQKLIKKLIAGEKLVSFNV